MFNKNCNLNILLCSFLLVLKDNSKKCVRHAKKYSNNICQTIFIAHAQRRKKTLITRHAKPRPLNKESAAPIRARAHPDANMQMNASRR